jgi:hypothetical protein
MADPLKYLEGLSARARREDPPRVDVSRHVLLKLKGEVPSPVWTMALIATGAAVGAAAVLTMSMPLIEMLTDPLSVFFVMALNALP